MSRWRASGSEDSSLPLFASVESRRRHRRLNLEHRRSNADHSTSNVQAGGLGHENRSCRAGGWSRRGWGESPLLPLLPPLRDFRGGRLRQKDWGEKDDWADEVESEEKDNSRSRVDRVAGWTGSVAFGFPILLILFILSASSARTSCRGAAPQATKTGQGRAELVLRPLFGRRGSAALPVPVLRARCHATAERHRS